MTLRHFFYGAGLLIIAFAIYFNSLPNGFNLDDNAIIKDNPLVTNLKNIPKIFVSNYWANTPYEKGVLLYRPIPVLTLAVDNFIWEGKPYGFHFTNVLINAVNIVLLFYVLIFMFGDALKPRYAALAALLFALHPVHTEAVNMIVGRTELLAAFFSFLAIIFYLRKNIAGALILFFCALLSKEIAVTIPVMLFLYELYSKKKIEIKNYFFFALVLGVYLGLRYFVLHGLSSIHQEGILAGQDIWARAATVIYVIGLYLKLLFAPFYLTADYSDYTLPASLLSFKVILSLTAILLLLAIAWKHREKKWILTFGILWFFITILPVSNIISIGALLGERFMYVPSAAFALIIAALFVYWKNIFVRSILVAVCTLICIVFGIYTFNRNFDWKDSFTLFAAAEKNQPNNPRVNYFMGLKAETDKDIAKAIKYYEMTVKEFPTNNWKPDSNTVNNMKARIKELGGIAVNKLESESIALYNTGLKLYKEKKYKESLEKLKKAVELNTFYADAYVVIGGIYVERQDPKNAIEYFEKALKVNPNHPEAKENLKRVREYYKIK
ncbi:MAG: hypothetical protein A2452_01490 [Candidatus Firestonebacteria bacterium RIFOXYC2_FULL_39_67]|nr:MAG: hypothetical protein A2536_12590 [Candidatus Firestonebacteria bacterium RIFOXYD2_FULL_39_29]OGF57038.1 MAG: hypothetical protein A2452_01490 [Candidatus Firestonebacteria bacterium RIFOXYC2_FULL_39_67]